MFTGIVDKLGLVVSVKKRPRRSATINVDLGGYAKDVKIGHSICVNGVCLTVTNKRKGIVSMDVIEETLKVTNLGELVKGSRVNIERALLATDRIGGHLVTGHVDGVGRVAKIEEQADASKKFWVETRSDLLAAMIPKGSIAVDGISLTLVDVEASRFSVCLIPHTLAVTTLSRKSEGDSVNLEVDMIGKYVREYLDKLSLEGLLQRRI